MGALYQHSTQDIPTLLSAVGVDHYTSQMLVPFMFMAPSTTDLDMPSVIEMIRAIQSSLNAIGGELDESGELDLPTAASIQQVTGPGWKSRPWYQIVEAIVYAADHGGKIMPARVAPPAMGATIDLPTPPGGILGWAAIAAAVYYFWGRKP